MSFASNSRHTIRAARTRLTLAPVVRHWDQQAGAGAIHADARLAGVTRLVVSRPRCGSSQPPPAARF
ncbi:hypothetical protein [Streptomyces albidoflavus]|uniref:hypothetical protein n=1 Tax=Streptomyces albidoflavus TaxID=1886 RepID=UPI0033CB37D4